MDQGFDQRGFSALAALAQACEECRDDAALAAALEQACREFPGHPWFLAERASLRMRRGEPDLAVADLQVALRNNREDCPGLHPANARLALELAKAYRAGGRWGAAMRWAEQAVMCDPDCMAPRALQARLYLEATSADEAERLLEAGLAEQPCLELWLALAELRVVEGNWPAALGAVAASVPLAEGGAVASLTDLLADLQTLSAGGGSQAFAVQRRVRAMTLFVQGDTLQAAEGFAEAIEADPQNPSNYRYLAASLDRVGMKEQALEAWQLAQYLAKER